MTPDPRCDQTRERLVHQPLVHQALPFYTNNTLPAEQRKQVAAHLPACPKCRGELEAWMLLAQGVREDVPTTPAPPMSPLLQTIIQRRRPTLAQTAYSAWNLVLAQRVFIFRGISVPLLTALVFVAILAALFLRDSTGGWVAVPFFAAIPVAGAMMTAFLYQIEDDPAFELVSALPASPGTLIFARLTLALGVLMCLALMGSLVVALVGGASTLQLVAAWLGPMLVLSALTTLLSVAWRPQTAAGVALAIWGGLVIVLARELGGVSHRVSLLWLLQPGWLGVVLQLLFAGVIFVLTWFCLGRGGSDPANGCPSANGAALQ